MNAVEAAALPASASSLRDARVLIVDDEPGLRALLSSELGFLGYSVETACDGAQALEMLHAQNFQIVLCDIKMPRVGGLAVLENVRQTLPEVEVIMMTGYGTVETAVAAMKHGAYDFIQKPFNLSEVLALVEKCLEKSRLRAVAALYQASQPIFRSMKLGELLPLVTDLALKIFQADDMILLLSDDAGQLNLASFAGLPTDERIQSRVTLTRRAVEKTELSKPLVLQSPLRPDALPTDLLGCEDVTSTLICPFSIDDERLGVLSLNRTRRTDPFLTSDVQHATIFASQIAQAVFNVRLYRRLDTNILELQKANRTIEETKQQLIQSEKLAGIGQLAAGIAHEINNPLTGVIGFTQLLLADSGNMTKQQRKDLESVHEQGKRCQAIIRNLLQFSRSHGEKKCLVDMIPLLQSTLDLVQHDFSISSIELLRRLPGSLPLIYGNEGQLQQIFLNLLTNARHAVLGKENARITIEAGVLDSSVFIRFKDNGLGISKEIIGKIFEPFFTTKPVGQGTGLGLSICYGIVQAHGGMLRVKSDVNVGSEFTLELPLHTEDKPSLDRTKEQLP